MMFVLERFIAGFPFYEKLIIRNHLIRFFILRTELQHFIGAKKLEEKFNSFTREIYKRLYIQISIEIHSSIFLYNNVFDMQNKVLHSDMFIMHFRSNRAR